MHVMNIRSNNGLNQYLFAVMKDPPFDPTSLPGRLHIIQCNLVKFIITV